MKLNGKEHFYHMIIKEYRYALKEMGLFKWSDYLSDREAYNCNTHQCLVCGQDVSPQYIGSHFQQTHTKLEEHQKWVSSFENRCKRIFESILKKYGLKLRESPERFYDHIWRTARLYVGSAVRGFNKAVEEA